MKTNIGITALILLMILSPISGYGQHTPAKTPRASESIRVDGYPLSLEEAIRLTLSHNFDIHIGRIEQKILTHEVPIAKARYDTTLDIDVDYEVDQKEYASSLFPSKSNTTNWNAGLSKKIPWGTTFGLNFFNTRSSAASSVTTLNPNYSSAGEFSITQPLAQNAFGMIDRGEVELIRLDVSRLSLEVLDNIEAAIAAVEQTYWDLEFAYQNLQSRQTALTAAEEFLAITKDQHDNGAAEDTDLYAAEANLLKRQNALNTAEQVLGNTSDDLALAINVFPEGMFIPTDNAVTRELSLDIDNHIIVAMKKSRAYQAQIHVLESQELDIKLKNNARWPELDLEASFTSNGLSRDMLDALGESASIDNPTYFIGARFSIPLENRKAQHTFDQAELLKAQELWKLKQIEKEIYIAVTKSIRLITTYKKNAERNETIKDLQIKKLKGEQEKYNYGRSSSDTIIRFQDDVIDADVALNQSLSDYEKALIDLKRAQNIILDEVDWVVYEKINK